jgi:hypothetical protein
MAHRSLNTLVFAGFDMTTAATVISMMGDDGLPGDIRIITGLMVEPWQTARTGLMIIGMDPRTDLIRVSQLLQNRTTYWDVAVCIPAVLSYYSVALLAQGAAKVLTHPEEDLEATKKELRSLLRTLSSIQSDAFGLEVSDLIQLYGDKRIPKTIRLTGDGVVGSIYLHNGNVVHSETMDDEEGMQAFRRLIGLRNPEIRVHKGCLTDKKTIGIPAMSALLEGSRQMDEISRESRADDLDADFELGSNDQIPSIGHSIQPHSSPPPVNLNIKTPPLYQTPRRQPSSESGVFKEDPLKNLFLDEELDIH